MLFTQQRRWTPRAYERWLADTWSRLLLAEGEGTDRARPDASTVEIQVNTKVEPDAQSSIRMGVLLVDRPVAVDPF